MPVSHQYERQMKRFIEGECRGQGTLLPELLDDYVAENNPVRVVDVFVDQLDLGELGFDGVQPAITGRPAYHPAVLLKLYIYGYLNRIQSSRRLEREAQRNVELMWLTQRLTPDFKRSRTSARTMARQSAMSADSSSSCASNWISGSPNASSTRDMAATTRSSATCSYI
jgi:transposase